MLVTIVYARNYTFERYVDFEIEDVPTYSWQNVTDSETNQTSLQYIEDGYNRTVTYDNMSDMVITYYSNFTNSTVEKALYGQGKWFDCKNNISSPVIDCSQDTYEDYIQWRMDYNDQAEEYNWRLFNGLILQNATYSVVTAEQYVEAPDFIVHSDGPRNLTMNEIRTITENLVALQNGEINKSKVPQYYKTQDGSGIKMWRIFIDLWSNTMKYIWQWYDVVNARLDQIESRQELLYNRTEELCDFNSQISWC